jgi:protein-S-isoprenylcysteine O-methyltransferase Ste14
MISSLGLWFLFAGYVVMVSFFIVQRRLRRTRSAKSFHGGAFDRGNTLLIGSATGLGLLLPMIADALGIATFPITLVEGLVALAVMSLGFGLRVWAAVSLGNYYTTTLMITEDHRVVSSGPYARIRHPGYLAEMLMWSGFGVLSSNLLLIFVIPVMIVSVYLYRISSEEEMLVRELGDDYVQYRRRTRKLIPGVY